MFLVVGDDAEGAGDDGLAADQLVQELVVHGQVGPLRADLLVDDPRHHGGDAVRLDHIDASALDAGHGNVDSVPGVDDSVDIEARLYGGKSAHVYLLVGGCPR